MPAVDEIITGASHQRAALSNVHIELHVERNEITERIPFDLLPPSLATPNHTTSGGHAGLVAHGQLKRLRGGAARQKERRGTRITAVEKLVHACQ
jgi:hypothetical protein